MPENELKEMSRNAFVDLKDELILEIQRLESFEHWPFPDTAPCSKIKMAQAGWYWTGTVKEPDAATCFLCHKTLDGWEETDNPWKEHAKHAPRCIFVKLGRPESELSVLEMLDIFNLVVSNKMQKKLDQIKTHIRANANEELKAFMKDNSK